MEGVTLSSCLLQRLIHYRATSSPNSTPSLAILCSVKVLGTHTLVCLLPAFVGQFHPSNCGTQHLAGSQRVLLLLLHPSPREVAPSTHGAL